jgi:molybdopterin molybdotransferase
MSLTTSDLRVDMQVLGFAEALDVVLRHAAGVRGTGVETVGLLGSAGRVLAQEVAADRDQPPFDRATRDGFVVRAGEWTSGRRLRVVGLLRAGEAWAGGALGPGESIEIMTGAAALVGADAVAMVEHAERVGDEVWAAAGRLLRAGENIVPRASEARRGEVLLAAGTAMGAAEIALAAACGRAELAVRRRPTVAIVATGDELVESTEMPEAHQIRNSNGYALAALVAAAGGEPRRLAIARDIREDVRARIEEGRESDLLLLSGGVSAGKYDLVEEVLAEFGADFIFAGVRMQPGRPVVFGRLAKAGRGGAPTQVSEARPGAPNSVEWVYFFGLPGNPVSTQVTFHCFVEPMLRAMCGAGVGLEAPRFVQAALGEEVKGKAGLTRLLPALLQYDLERPEVRLVGWQGSGDMAANARANCYAVLPDGRDLQAGDVITVLLR